MRLPSWIGGKKYDADATARMVAALNRITDNDADMAAEVTKALNDNADPNARIDGFKGEKDACTALLHACFYKQRETARALLEHGADVNAYCPKDGNHYPLLAACGKYMLADYALIKLLVDHGADVTKTDANHNTPLHGLMLTEDIFESDIDPVKVLLGSRTLKNKRAYVNAPNSATGLRPLHMLMENMHALYQLPLLESLLTEGVDLNAAAIAGTTIKTSKGEKPLYRLSHKALWSGMHAAEARKFLALMQKYGGELDNTHETLTGGETRVIDKLVRNLACGSLLQTMLDSGAGPSKESIDYLLHSTAADEQPALYRATVIMLALSGVDLNGNGSLPNADITFPEAIAQRFRSDWPALIKGKKRLSALERSGISLGEWLEPSTRETLLAALTMLNEGETLFAPEHWRSAEERNTAYQLLPVQARRWVKNCYPDLAPLFREDNYPSLAEALKNGKLDLGTLAPGGKPSLQLLTWREEIGALSDPQHWKNGTHDVIALQGLLPEELSRHIDTSYLQRNTPTPREDSVTVDYLHGSPTAGKGVA